MSDPYVGEIRMFSGNYAPQDWALCNGQMLPIQGNETLYSLIGTTYGGDGTTNFALPDLRGRLPIHRGQNPHTGTTYVIGQTGGTETVMLTEAQLPVHTHTACARSGNGTQTEPANNLWAAPAGNFQYLPNTAADKSMNAANIAATGGGQAHYNMMPYLAINFIICLNNGIFPVQG